MAVMITDVTTDRSVELAGDSRLSGMLLDQLLLAVNRLGREHVSSIVLARMVSLCLDLAAPDVRPPTTAQVRYALALAAELAIPLPDSVLAERWAMHRFLAQHGARNGTRSE